MFLAISVAWRGVTIGGGGQQGAAAWDPDPREGCNRGLTVAIVEQGQF